jgi:hypothetical protein
MSKCPHTAATETSRERVVFIDILEQQMLDLEALRKKVAEAERRAELRNDKAMRLVQYAVS